MTFESKTNYYSSVEVEEKALGYCNLITDALIDHFEDTDTYAYVQNPSERFYAYVVVLDFGEGKPSTRFTMDEQRSSGYKRNGNGVLYFNISIRYQDKKMIRETKEGMNIEKILEEVDYQLRVLKVAEERENKTQKRISEAKTRLGITGWGGVRYGPLKVNVDDNGFVTISGNLTLEKWEKYSEIFEKLNEVNLV